ncbi:MAG: hypothetical protein AAFN70_14280, partial [Planctomycetota bacterium]
MPPRPKTEIPAGFRPLAELLHGIAEGGSPSMGNQTRGTSQAANDPATIDPATIDPATVQDGSSNPGAIFSAALTISEIQAESASAAAPTATPASTLDWRQLVLELATAVHADSVAIWTRSNLDLFAVDCLSGNHPEHRNPQIERIVAGCWSDENGTQLRFADSDDTLAIVSIHDATGLAGAVSALSRISVSSPKARTATNGTPESDNEAIALPDSIRDLLATAIRKHSASPLQIQAFDAGMQQLQQSITQLQRKIRTSIDDTLRKLAGVNTGSLTENQRIVCQLQELLDRHG